MKSNDWFFDKFDKDFNQSPAKFFLKYGVPALILSLVFYAILIGFAGFVLWLVFA